MHETFHNIVHNNPDFMPYLMKTLESEYGRQEIAALVNGYIEAYDGIYGTFEDGMTEAQQEALVMQYMEEVFADVYGDVRRGKYRTTAAQKIMRDQTDAMQRAAQNRKGMENKKAPPKQSFSKAENNTGYAERNLTEDESVYSYDFLIRQDDMFVTKLPEVPAIRNNDGRISRENVAEMGLDNARTVGHEENGKIFVKNNYTGKNLQITASAIRHSLDGDGKRMLTNARLGAVVGELAKNAIPVNALHNTAKNASGTYAMAAYAQDSQERNFVAILTVEQYETKISAIEIFDVLHALNGRQKNSSRADTKSQGVNPSTAAKLSIAEFLRIVNTTHQSILSKNVLDVLNEEKSRNGYYADRTKFSVENDAQEDFIEQAIDMEKRQKKQEEELQQAKAKQATDDMGEQKAYP